METNRDETEKKHKADPSLLEPYQYINSVPGKDIRGKLIDCFQLWLQVDEKQTLEDIKLIVSELHNASLLIDDIEDNSRLRRGVPVAHSIFGVAPVINCANYVYFLSLQLCQRLGNPKAMEVFIAEMLNLHRGQGYDIMWRDQGKCPTEEQYCNMVLDKTGGLFRLAVGLMQTFASKCTDTDFTPLLNKLGLYFQIRDDLINLADPEYMKNKSFCEDLTEGKFSFPIIHFVRKDETDRRLLSILKQRTEDLEVKKYAQGLMRKAGSLRYTWEKCIALENEITCLVQSLGGNPPLLKVLELLHVHVERLEEVVSSDY